jgi:hypothetical protein
MKFWNWEEWFVTVLLLVVVVFVLGFFINDWRWEKYKVEHNCKYYTSSGGEVIPTVGVAGNGQVMFGYGISTTTETWVCDDSVIVYH